jgi:hypothetical protein
MGVPFSNTAARVLRDSLVRSVPATDLRTKKTKGLRAATRLAAPWRQGTETGSDSSIFPRASKVNSQRQLGWQRKERRMARNRKKRRQQHGSAWHWKQTDCWYPTERGTGKRVPLFDEVGERIRGKGNKEAARVARDDFQVSLTSMKIIWLCQARSKC